ncbi:DUF1016 N-terminal domain-containing protein [Paraburkholderia sp. MMS20-SJTN17]|uniref:DUF1016 N-terminal domain-containing protein n=1 Tax=Paraburkholderia translucens TaxID=2886945 RepID=A0ABS8KKK2_9BURK|nr:DUF1016 N-terminal domain-containing protein [Paraburkholderia sp. MMS20-SJTN17]
MASANREPVALYWQIARDIFERRQKQGWGASVVDRLASHLKTLVIDRDTFFVKTSVSQNASLPVVTLPSSRCL